VLCVTELLTLKDYRNGKYLPQADFLCLDSPSTGGVWACLSLSSFAGEGWGEVLIFVP